MINKKLLFTMLDQVNIYIMDSENLVLEDGSYLEEVKERYSLLRLLPLLEQPVDEIIKGIKDNSYKIEDILPINELMLFLITKMQSSYWVNLLCEFLLNDQIHFSLNSNVLNSLKDREIINWLPQRQNHLIRKVVSKSMRL